MSDKQVLVVYLAGAIGALLSLIWFNRKTLAKGDWGDQGEIFLAVTMGTFFWPLVLAGIIIFGIFWTLGHAAELTAKGMVRVESYGERRREKRALAEKAQREIFADIDLMLKEGREDEVRTFMSKLKACA